ncbi:MAG TPA: RodZ domain-containing protein [Permianibacter sp.]|nr:RodZ domain-containing protein [Permianibacter sp.]
MAELNVEAPAAVPTEGPGARLRAGREAQGQSLEQAARHLRLDEPTLAAIEADQYPAHVPATFLRGYLRAYAKWLELPADDIVLAYNQRQPDEAQLAGLKTLLALPESERSASGKWLWFGLVALAVVVIGGAVVLMPTDWLDKLKSEDSAVVSEQAESVEILPIESSSGELMLQLPPEAPLPDAGATTGAATTESTAVSAPAATTPAPATTSATTAGAATPTASTPSSTGASTASSSDAVEALPGIAETLELTFIEDCWIRVTDANGNVLSVGIKQNGQRIRLSGSAPLTVVLGNPPGVQLKHNGRPVDLSSYPGSRPATLTLQQQAND